MKGLRAALPRRTWGYLVYDKLDIKRPTISCAASKEVWPAG